MQLKQFDMDKRIRMRSFLDSPHLPLLTQHEGLVTRNGESMELTLDKLVYYCFTKSGSNESQIKCEQYRGEGIIHVEHLDSGAI